MLTESLSQMSVEEINELKEKINNPPKYIKVKNYFDKTIISAYTHSLSGISVVYTVFAPIILGLILGFSKKPVFGKETDFDSLFYTGFCLVLLVISILFLSRLLLLIFGRIDLAFGSENYLFTGFWFIGKKRPVDWKTIDDILVFKTIQQVKGIRRLDFLFIKQMQNKEIKIKLEKIFAWKVDLTNNHPDKKMLDFLVLIVKYFAYRSSKEAG